VPARQLVPNECLTDMYTFEFPQIASPESDQKYYLFQTSCKKKRRREKEGGTQNVTIGGRPVQHSDRSMLVTCQRCRFEFPQIASPESDQKYLFQTSCKKKRKREKEGGTQNVTIGGRPVPYPDRSMSTLSVRVPPNRVIKCDQKYYSKRVEKKREEEKKKGELKMLL